jgi:UDP-N-acetylglucosamine acyltransferase
MIGGGARISLDIAPFSMATERNAVIGLNVVGLRRRGVSRPVMDEIKRAFRAVSAPVGNLREIAASTLQQGNLVSAEARSLLEFFQGGRRGFARPRQGVASDAADGEQ